MTTRKTKILYSVAYDSNENLVYASSAKKEDNYHCPTCKGVMILRKSEKIGKNRKRPHFAHKQLTPNCTSESVLHFSFKKIVYNHLKKLIAEDAPFEFSWNCKVCSESHSGNLLKQIKDIKLEHNLKICQPDIALFDNEHKVFAVIEVVVTHQPEESALNYYTKNNIILIQINLDDDRDVENFSLKLAHPDKVDVCLNSKCKNCGHHKLRKVMTIIEGPCWKCDSTMKIASIPNNTGVAGRYQDSNLSPKKFTEEEISFAKSKGVIIKRQYSKTQEDYYLANTCKNCGAFAGEFYLFTDYVAPAAYGDLPSENHDMGFQCGNCM